MADRYCQCWELLGRSCGALGALLDAFGGSWGALGGGGPFRSTNTAGPGSRGGDHPYRAYGAGNPPRPDSRTGAVPRATLRDTRRDKTRQHETRRHKAPKDDTRRLAQIGFDLNVGHAYTSTLCPQGLGRCRGIGDQPLSSAAQPVKPPRHRSEQYHTTEATLASFYKHTHTHTHKHIYIKKSINQSITQ